MERSFGGVYASQKRLCSFQATWMPSGERAVWVAVVRDEDGRILASPSGELPIGRASSVRSRIRVAIERMTPGPQR